MERREFLKNIALGGLALALNPLSALASKTSSSARVVVDNSAHLTILHCNDVHSHIDPFPINDPKFPGMGGYARRASLIRHTQESVGKENMLVFESGDMFQGTPYFNLYKGKVEIELMNKMGVDAVTIGNHEFDNGLNALVDRMQEANFPFICSNYTFTNERALKTVKSYQIFERAGKRIGVLGLGVKIDGLISPRNTDGTIYNDPIAVGNETAAYLKNVEKCDFVIALTHLGHIMTTHVDDVHLAGASTDIDLILGGHTHTFLTKPEYYPNANGKEIIVNQAGYGGLCVGRIEIIFDGDKLNAWRMPDTSINVAIG